MSKASDDVLAERQRQIEGEGWSAEHDDLHKHGDLAGAAACYTLNAAIGLVDGAPHCPAEPCMFWPWAREWWKPKDPRRDLVRAAALIIAEIERIDRLGTPRDQSTNGETR